jgi:hypothetical protein
MYDTKEIILSALSDRGINWLAAKDVEPAFRHCYHIPPEPFHSLLVPCLFIVSPSPMCCCVGMQHAAPIDV